MALSSCSDEVKSGTIQIEITDIPTEVMTEARSRGFYAKLIRADAINGEDGSFPPAALLTVWDAKRIPADDTGTNSVTFKFYKVYANPMKEWTGEAGNYAIYFGIGEDGNYYSPEQGGGFIINIPLSVNKLNVIPFASFEGFEGGPPPATCGECVDCNGHSDGGDCGLDDDSCEGSDAHHDSCVEGITPLPCAGATTECTTCVNAGCLGSECTGNTQPGGTSCTG